MSAEQRNRFEKPIERSGPTFLPKVMYVAENVATFGTCFEDKPVTAAFSWGAGPSYLTGNMVEKYAVPEDVWDVRQRRFDFLTRAGMGGPIQDGRVVQFTTRKRDGNPIQEITATTIEDHAQLSGEIALFDGTIPRQFLVGTDFTLTRQPNVILSVYPADCHVSVIHGSKHVDGQTEHVLGILHGGYQEIAQNLPQNGIKALQDLGFDPQDITIGITPGMGPANYFFKETDVHRLGEGWNDYLTPVANHRQGEQGFQVDALGKLLAAYEHAGIPLGNITAHARSVDTYEAAQMNEAFSHRFATVEKLPMEQQGRIIVAAQLTTA